MLISPEYQALQQETHEDENYGIASQVLAPLVSNICNNLQIAEILDYGAGKCRLFEHLRVGHPMSLQAYDPGIPDLAGRPSPSQLVCCIDVLEHIEPACLESVLDDLRQLTGQFAFITVGTLPAKRVLPDGRNAHLIVEDERWWLPKLMSRWDLEMYQRRTDGFMTLLSARIALA